VRYSIGVRMQRVIRDAIEAIGEHEWQRLDDYPASGVAEIAETTYGAQRLIVRRVRSLGTSAQGELFPDWRHYAFITDRTEPLAMVEAAQRQHAVVELAIRDHIAGALRHLPSGRFAANAAWTVIAALAANLARWTSILGLANHTPQAQATLRRRLLVVPARLVRHGRRTTLRLPARWPWRTAWIECLTRLRGLPRLS
jgi:Transposase DDE domain group 1